MKGGLIRLSALFPVCQHLATREENYTKMRVERMGEGQAQYLPSPNVKPDGT